MAEDVRRWIFDEPVRAHPEGITQTTARWLRRNRKPVSVGVVLLFVSLLVGSFLVLREQQRTLAYANRVQTLAENGFRILQTFEPYIASDANFNQERRRILIDSAKAYQEILSDFSPDDRTRRMAAHMFRFAANLHRFDYEVAEAERMYQSAIDVYRDLMRKSPNNDDLIIQLALIYIDYGQLFSALGQWDEARKITEKAQTEMQKTIRSKMLEPAQVRMDGLIFLSLAAISHNQERFQQGAIEAKKALDAVEALKRSGKLKGYEHIMLHQSLVLLGINAREQNKLEESTTRLEEARNILRPFIDELQLYDQNIVRDITKLDILQNYTNCKLEQNYSLLKAGKNLDKLEASLNALVQQTNLLTEAYPNNPRIKLLHSAALAVRGNYYLNFNKSNQSAADFNAAKAITNQLTINYPAIASIKTKHREFIKKMETK